MANRDALKDILFQMQNLKLSSPLQSKDENKENILAGQDIHIPKSDRNSENNPVITVTSTEEYDSIPSECQEIDVNSYETSEESSPTTPVISSPDLDNTVSNFEPSDVTIIKDGGTCEQFEDAQSTFCINEEQNNTTTNSTDSETSLVNITRTNCSVEDLEASTANLVSDSSVGSLSTSLNTTRSSELNLSTKHNISAKEVNVIVEDSQNKSFTVSATEPIETLAEEPVEQQEVDNISGQPVEQQEVDNICEEPPVEHQEVDNICEQPVEHQEVDKICEQPVEQQEVDNISEVTSNIPEEKMDESNEKIQQEFSDIRLELNAVQQAKATLELEISKKEEIILKTQAESMKKEQQYVQEIKSLKEQLKEKTNNIIEKDTQESKDSNSLKDLEEALRDAKAEKQEFIKVLEEYEKTMAKNCASYAKLKEENASLNRHLSNLELSFSDLHQKYEKAKTVIFGFKRNEDKLREGFQSAQETFRVQEGRYESLKAYAQTQIDKCNVEILQQRDTSESEIKKLKATVKRLEIKIAALETSLEQKTKECVALAALFDEVTGKNV